MDKGSHEQRYVRLVGGRVWMSLQKTFLKNPASIHGILPSLISSGNSIGCSKQLELATSSEVIAILSTLID
jgi:hypothetical protein